MAGHFSNVATVGKKNTNIAMLTQPDLHKNIHTVLCSEQNEVQHDNTKISGSLYMSAAKEERVNTTNTAQQVLNVPIIHYIHTEDIPS